MKNKKNVGLIGILLFSLVACGGNEDSSSLKNSNTIKSSITSTSSSISIDNNENVLSLEVKVFIEQVTLLENESITLGHKSQIDGVYFLYNSLTSEMKLLNEVIAAKEKLDKIKEDFLYLYEEYLLSKEVEETADAFKQLVDSLGEVDALIREDKKDVDKLLDLYNTFSIEIKENEEVQSSKEKLDLLNNRIIELVNMSDDEYNVVLFISMVNKLPAVDELTIYDIDVVNEAITTYNELDDLVKDNSDVIAAKAKLDLLSERVSHLQQVKENADNFVNLVYDLPTFNELEWNDQNQNSAITAAENAYNSLTEEEKQVSSVANAYKELQAIRVAFDNLKEPYDIKKISFGISLNHPQGSLNRSGAFTYTPGKDHITILTNEYNIPRDELSKYVTVYLNIYIEGGAVPSQPLYSYDITEDYSGYDCTRYVETLKELRDNGNDKVKSGIGYTFTVNIVSLNEQYASSKYSGFTGGQAIYF